MKEKIRIIICLMMMLFIISFLSTTVFAVSDLTQLNNKTTEYLGNVFYMSWSKSLQPQGSNLYCIQQNVKLDPNPQPGVDSPEVKFILDTYIEINGKEATVYKNGEAPYTVKANVNAEMAYILGNGDGYSKSAGGATSDAQYAFWHIANSWTRTILGDNNVYVHGGNDEIGRQALNNQASAYANAIGDNKAPSIAGNSGTTTTPAPLSVKDVTDRSKLSAKDTGDGYKRVGPFRWEFGGTLKNILVNGGAVTNVRFVKYTGNTANIVNVSDILTGEPFYVDLSGTSQLNSLTLNTDSSVSNQSSVYTAKIWLFQTGELQNLMYTYTGNTNYQPNSGTGTSNYNITISTGIGLTKKDDRDNTPLPNVGFQFSATIQKYEEVRRVEHTKSVSCTHEKHVSCTHEKHVPCTHIKRVTCVHEKFRPNGLSYNPKRYEHSYDEEREHQYDTDGYEHSYDTDGYEHDHDDVYDYTEIEYDWNNGNTMYLQSDGSWGSSPHTFYTNSVGQIIINNITFKNQTITIKYDKNTNVIKDQKTTDTERLKPNTKVTAIEVSNPNYGYSHTDANGNNLTFECDISTNTNGLAQRDITNHQGLVKLSGYVWLDGNEEKQTIRNDLFDQGEAGLNGIIVRLKHINGSTIKTTTTSELGLYSEINGGEYRFTDIDLGGLQRGEYYVEFEYCGIVYQSINPKLTENRGSKAVDTTSRNILDSKFSAVNGNGSQSLNMNGVTVNYNGINNYVSTISNHTGCNVIAKTNEAGYNLYSGFKPATDEVRYVNLGLFEKAQTDYALSQDLYDVKVSVNGFSHIYRYAKTRYNDDGSENGDSSWNVGVKFQNNRGTYDRAIYKSDVNYEAPNHKDNEVKVYLTYKIALRNESQYLGRINSIVNYTDSRSELIAVGTGFDNQENVIGTISFGAKTSANNGYSKYVINTNTLINPGNTTYLYAQFRLDRAAVLTIMNNGDLINNLTEINSYTTFKNNNSAMPVAVIDKDSVPGNVMPGNFNTYEDDTDAARSLRLEFKNERDLKGTVFVDSTGKDTNLIYKGQERIGNGILNNGEKPLAGITVKLREIGKDDSSYNGERVEMTTTTNANGEYRFEGYIPGNYILTYIWGDKTYKVQYYKGTIYDVSVNQNNPYWYKNDVGTRKTDALDNYSIREKIDDEMEAVKTNILENEINKAYNGGSSYITQTKMESLTPIMTFDVEYNTTITNGTMEEVKFTIENVDFGIVERPKQKLDLSKRISKYKITLANGQTLVDAEIDENGNITGAHDYTMYIKPAQIKTEMDTELIEGATLEITYLMKVTNVGELDYMSNNYYYYGIDKIPADLVKSSVTGLIDYMDGRLSIVDSKWNEKDKTYLVSVNASEKDNTSYINSTRTYLTEHLAKALAPGESNTVDLHVSKLLTSSDDNTFDNKAEIVEVTKTPGFNTGTPVKVTWNGNKFNFNVSNSERVIIVPNTGENRDYVLPIVIGVTTLIVLGAGAFAIKKFVIG